MPKASLAQSIDSLTTALASTSVAVRANAVEALSGLSPNALPSSTRDALIALLEREATGTEPVDSMTHSDQDESWGEYIIGLSDLVRTLNDARSPRTQGSC